MTRKSIAAGLCLIAAVVIAWLFVFGPWNYSGRGNLRNIPDYKEQMEKGDLPDEGDFRGFDEEGTPQFEKPKGD